MNKRFVLIIRSLHYSHKQTNQSVHYRLQYIEPVSFMGSPGGIVKPKVPRLQTEREMIEEWAADECQH